MGVPLAMTRRIRITAVLLLLCAGWLSAFAVTGLYGRSSVYLLLPALLLGSGLGLLLKQVNIRQTVMALAATALFSLVLINQFLPQFSPRLSSLRQLKPEVHQVTIQPPPLVDGVVLPALPQLSSHVALHATLFAVLPGAAHDMVYRRHRGVDQVFVSLPDLGAIYLLQDRDSDGFSEQPILYHVGLDRPVGMAWIEDRLYVAEPSRVLELMDTTGDQQVDRERVVLDGLPDDGGHWQRGLVADDRQQLYLSVGSRCNACEEEDARRGTLIRINPESGQATEFARGLRYTLGLAVSADGGRLWGADISRRVDNGVRPPPDELNLIEEGGDYGWPYCYGDQRIDRWLGNPQRCQQTVPSHVDLLPGSSPVSIAFARDLAAAGAEGTALYIVNSGVGTSLLPPDYRVLLLPFAEHRPAAKPRDFLFGWFDQGQSRGRPIAVAAGNEGVLYVSDEQNRAVYRFRSKGGD